MSKNTTVAVLPKMQKSSVYFFAIIISLAIFSDFDSAQAATYAQWSSVNKSSQIQLTNFNLTAENTTGDNADWYGLTSDLSVSTGKYYWEVTVDRATANNYMNNGVALSTVGLTNGGGTDQWSYNSVNGNNYGLGSACGASYPTGTVLGFSLDIDAGTLEVFKNNTSQCTITGITGPVYAFANLARDAGFAPGAKITANFGDSAFTYTVPSGYNAGFGDFAGGGGDATTIVASTTIISDPNRDTFNLVLLFFIGMFFIIWLFSKKR